MSARRDRVANGTGRIVITTGPGDLDLLSQVIADAFHGLDVSQWLIPDPDARRRVFPAYWRIFVEHAMDTGHVHTTPDRTAVALWLPVGADGPRPPRHYDARLEAATGPWAGRFAILDEAFEAHHLVGVPHSHLAVLAVQPDQQRKGIGTALLEMRHTVLDDSGVPAYLEASGTDTRDLYLRHGYLDIGGPIRLSDGPALYPMIRAPRRAEAPAGSAPVAG
jgi:GNAT superfamily N-acetyltransferase